MPRDRGSSVRVVFSLARHGSQGERTVTRQLDCAAPLGQAIMPRDRTHPCKTRRPAAVSGGAMVVTKMRLAPSYPMKSIADQLPPEIAQQIHPDRRKNEAAYRADRDQLLDQYGGQWIGFADGRVIASGSSPVTVFQAAEATALHPFFICVGREEEPRRLQADFAGSERILGRDVLIPLEILFRGPAGQVVVSP